MQGATRTTPKRNSAVKAALLLTALMISTSLLLAYPVSVQGKTVAPGTLPSWNPAVSCTARLTTIEGVIGNQVNANGGSTYAGGGFQPGNPNKRSTSPPCSVNGNATFVEIHGVVYPGYTIEDCAQCQRSGPELRQLRCLSLQDTCRDRSGVEVGWYCSAEPAFNYSTV